MNENQDNTTTSPILDKPVKASSSLQDAFKSKYNIFILFSMTFTGITSITLYLVDYYNIFSLFVGVACIILIPLEIWSLLTRSLEISKKGIRFEEGRKRIFFNWDEIDAIKIDKFWGQITFWNGNEKTRINLFGLNSEQFSIVKEALLRQVQTYKIAIR